MSSIKGGDSTGKTYDNVGEMWKHELQGDLYDPEKGWYGKAISYWKAVPATVDGVLGGLESVHPDDIAESRKFLGTVMSDSRTRALDCGAGIGRLTETLILPLGFATVDLIEPIEHMIAAAKERLDPARIGKCMQVSMQQAELTDTYDLVVIQWVGIYLTDDDLAAFIASCKAKLNPGGVIFFKENCSSDSEFMVDKDDSSLTRSNEHYRAIFAAAGTEVAKSAFQKKWRKDLFPVIMYALK